MATIECRSSQRGVEPRQIDVEGITDEQVLAARRSLARLIRSEQQVSTAVALAFSGLAETCPTANPSDLWQHVIYRHLLSKGWSDNKWKRVSGFALERALVSIYEPRLASHQLRMRIFKKEESIAFFEANGLDIQSSKIDLFIEGFDRGQWKVFGAAHVKSSIAERIQDDVPTSLKLMEGGYLSIALTMDSKSYPPPHGNCVNYGELGGRSLGIEKDRIKRAYVEERGQFDGLFSFNLRTPPSPALTASGKRIYTLSLADEQPDQLVSFLVQNWTVKLARGPAESA